ncbi:START domain-containing protein [Pseudomonas sp. UL073]|uniref:START domain-containing protein n=1 Tax=Zestomonas insulae TaxID=2809017 RepID=A0ABS2IGD5_9GAMM|nr:START domain-containing protein [Pseudomonas insulae]MBM7062142.1 START domain-containing protein [Pseudomonas insulae]
MNMMQRMALACGMSLLLAGAVQAEDWQLAKDEQGIKVYLSSVPGSKYKAYRGVVDIKADVQAINALQEDVQGSCAWIHACAEMRLLKGNGDEAWTYSKIEMPWPVTGRDLVLHVKTDKAADGSIVRHLQAEPKLVPEENGQIRVPKLVGEWKMTPKGPGVTEVVYQVQTEPGGSIPSWLANSFVVDAPFNTLHDLREKAEKGR